MAGVEIATAYISLVPSFKGGEASITKALGNAPAQAGTEGGKSYASKFASGLGGIVGGVVKTVAAVGAAIVGSAAVGVGALLKVGVGYNTLEQTSRAAFTTLLGTKDAANKMVADISAFGKTSPFPRQAFLTGTQQLLGFGVSAERIIPTLQAVQDAVAATGGGAAQITSITTALAQIQGQGKLSGDTLSQLGQYGIDAAAIIGAGMGKTSNEIRDMASKPGGIPAAQVYDVLINGLEKKFAGAAGNVKQTFAGATDSVKGAFRDLGSAIAEPFVSKQGGGAAVTFMGVLSTAIRGLIPSVTLIAGVFTSGFNSGGFTSFVATLSAKIASLEAQFTSFLQNGGLTELTGGFRAFIAAFKAGDGDVTSSGFPGKMEQIANVARTIYDGFIKIKDVVVGLFSGGTGGAGGAGGFSDSLSKLAPLLQLIPALGDGVGKAFTIVNAVLGFLAAHVNTIITLLPLLAAGFVVMKVVEAAGNAVASAMPAIRVLQIIANRQLVRSNIELAASIRALALAQGIDTATAEAETGARNQGAIASIRARAAAIGSAIATKASAAAAVVMTGAQWLLNAAMSANPIVLVVIALIALGVGLYLLWTKVTAFRVGVTAAFDAVWGFIKDWGPRVLLVLAPFLAIPLLIKDHFGQIVGFLTSAWDTVVGFLVTWGPVALAVIFPFLGIPLLIFQHFGAIKGYLSDAFSSALSTVTGFVGQIVSAVTGIPGKIGAVAGQMLTAGQSLMGKFWEGLGSAVSGIASFASDIASKIWNGVKATINSGIDGIRNFEVGAFGVNVKPFSALPPLAVGGLTTGPTLAMVGDNRSGQELVMPMDSPRTVAVLAKAMSASGGAGRGNTTWNITEQSDPIATAHAVIRRQRLQSA